MSEETQETATDNSHAAVVRDLDRVCDHLMQGRTTPEQRAGLKSATERADRVRAGSDAAVGRALK